MNKNEQKLMDYIKAHPSEVQWYDMMLTLLQDSMEHGMEGYHAYNRQFRNFIIDTIRRLGTAEPDKVVILNEAYKRSLLLDARVDFDAYMLYLEQNREPKKRFYLPRRSKLMPVVRSLQALEGDEIDLLGISLPPGVGKALANDTPILTRSGWKNHGDLVVGDEVVGMDGQFKKVIAVHPKCQLDCLVEFTNGEKIVCHENHEWLIHDRGNPKKDDYIAETKYLEKRKLEGGEKSGRGHRYIIQLPYRKPIVGENKKLPLDPYTFGVWLGDGATNNPRISSPVMDRFIIFKIIKNGIKVVWHTQHKTTNVMYYSLDIRKELSSMGMCHSRKTLPKYIPEEYLTASIEQRMELLAGLLDTDGTLSEGVKYQYTTTSEKLLDGFIKLISTFGWRASVTSYKPTVSTSGVHGNKTTYVVGFTPDAVVPCVLERKRIKKPHGQRHIGFKSITRTEPKEGNCITVEGDGMYLAGRTMLPTHNTTLAIFFLTWLAGKYPDEQILTGSHSNAFVRGVYDECLRIFDKNGEYLWHDVFPDLGVSDTNAKDCRIDIGHRNRFETLEFTSIGTGNAGLYRASRLLYCDDLVSGIEVALSKERLDKLWETYTTDLRQRKIGDHCKELHIATRWSVHDPIGRLESQYDGNDRARFIVIPALNEADESNFDYVGGVGFSTAFYHEQRDIMEDASWRALYMNQPIEREGQLYHPDELRRFFELPEREPDAILAVCDTKAKGSDYAFMPVMYLYGQDCYIGDCVCDNGDPGVVEERLAQCLYKNKVQMCQFESNAAGWHIAEKIQKRVKELGWNTHITTKPTTSNKDTKIIVNAPEVKRRCLFYDSTKYRINSDYGRAMNMLTGYTLMGKNKHDDVPDGMAMAVLYLNSLSASKVEVIQRPF